MALNGVISGKLRTLDETLFNLRSLGRLTVRQVESDWRTKMAVERALQILVEIVIDVCQHIIAEAGHTPPSSGREAIASCAQMNVLSSTEPYQRMVQFRNFVVHLYERVDALFLVDIVSNRLTDFERFRDEVLAYVNRADENRQSE